MNDLTADLAIKSDNRLSLGGVPPEISKNNYYYPNLLVYEYEGCIRNVRINGQIKDLSLVSKANYNLATANCDCKYQYKQTTDCIVSGRIVPPTPEFPWWIILIVIAALILLGKLSRIFIKIIKFLIQLAKKKTSFSNQKYKFNIFLFKFKLS